MRWFSSKKKVDYEPELHEYLGPDEPSPPVKEPSMKKEVIRYMHEITIHFKNGDRESFSSLEPIDLPEARSHFGGIVTWFNTESGPDLYIFEYKTGSLHLRRSNTSHIKLTTREVKV